MRFGSLFSGIEAASAAWGPLGWECQWVAEFEKFPSAVLAHHYPDVPNLGDVTKVDWEEVRATRPVDCIVFGSPCQSFSIAGKRLGLDDPRGNLALYALGVVNRLRPRWFVFENVPGLLSSGGGRDFGAFLGTVGECGYQCAWRILDAQFFGLAQRRARVFVVGYLGDWRRAAAVLFERESLQGNPPPRREAGQRVAPSLAPGTGGGGGHQYRQRGNEDCLIAKWPAEVAPTLNAHFGDKQGLEDQHALNGAGLFVAHSLRAEGFDASEDGTGRGTPIVAHAYDMTNGTLSDDVFPTLQAEAQRTGNRGAAIAFSAKDHGADAGVMPAVAFDTTQITSKGNYSNPKPGDPCHPLAAGAHPPAIAGSAVRRLTPRECERLQGFPDDYTLVSYRGKPAADGPRYKALGNSMAVPVMSWIGRRIAMVESLSLKVAA